MLDDGARFFALSIWRYVNVKGVNSSDLPCFKTTSKNECDGSLCWYCVSLLTDKTCLDSASSNVMQLHSLSLDFTTLTDDMMLD